MKFPFENPLRMNFGAKVSFCQLAMDFIILFYAIDFVINFILKFLFLVNEKFFSYTRIREEIIPRIEVTFAEDCKLCYYSDSGQ